MSLYFFLNTQRTSLDDGEPQFHTNITEKDVEYKINQHPKNSLEDSASQQPADTISTNTPQSQPCRDSRSQSSFLHAEDSNRQLAEDISISARTAFGWMSSDEDILCGNLLHRTDDTSPAKVNASSLLTSPDAAGFSREVLMKPEDFLKKKDGTSFPLEFLKTPEADQVTKGVEPVASNSSLALIFSSSSSSCAEHRDWDNRNCIKDAQVNGPFEKEPQKLPGIFTARGRDGDTEDSPSNTASGKSAVTFASCTLNITDELCQIRDHLRKFKQQKKKLR